MPRARVALFVCWAGAALVLMSCARMEQEIGAALTTTPFDTVLDVQTMEDLSDFVVLETLDVPVSDKEYNCGAQALATVAHYHAPSTSADAFLQKFSSLPSASTIIDLHAAAKKNGYVALIRKGEFPDLQHSLEQARPPIVLLSIKPEFTRTIRTVFGPRIDEMASRREEVPGSTFHWGVISGMKRDGSAILLAAPRGMHFVMAREDFERRWNRADRCLLFIQRVGD